MLLIGRAKSFVLTDQKHYPDLGNDASSAWNFCPRFLDVIGGETSSSDVKCLLFSQAKTSIHANSLFIAEGLAQTVGRLPAESGWSSCLIPKAGSILGVLKELRNEGTRRITAVPSRQRDVKIASSIGAFVPNTLTIK